MEQLSTAGAGRPPFYVQDLQAATSFYRQVTRSTVLVARGGTAQMRLPDGSVLQLTDAGHPESGRTEREGPGPLAGDRLPRRVTCATTELSMREWERHLFINGVVVEKTFTGEGDLIDLCFSDPDGNQFVLVGDAYGA